MCVGGDYAVEFLEIEFVTSVWRLEMFGAWNAGTEVRRLEDISMVPSFRCGRQAPNRFF